MPFLALSLLLLFPQSQLGNMFLLHLKLGVCRLYGMILAFFQYNFFVVVVINLSYQINVE